MNNMRYFLTSILAVVYVTAIAQVQSGYVKTLGRPGHKGQALSGVSVRIKGAHNAVLSRNDGRFTIDIQGGSGSFVLQQVEKTGYELNDANMIGRSYAFSSSVPLSIVMVSTKQIQYEKQRIEDIACATAEKNYKAQVRMIEEQKAKNEITIEQYSQQIRELQDRFEKYQSLISGLADHFARTDYDNMDNQEREINQCIENGELERAEMLLQQMGFMQRLESIQKRIVTGQEMIESANKDMVSVLKQQEKDAEHLYQLYTIALSRFDNEKAQYYIETRAALDPQNVKWQIEAGEFMVSYICDFDAALTYFTNAIHFSGELSMERAECYNDIGYISMLEGNLDEASKYLKHSLEIRSQIVPDDHPKIGLAYNSLATCLSYQGKYDDAIYYYMKSLTNRKAIFGENSREVALIYTNIGATYVKTKKFDNALHYLQKALQIVEALKPQGEKERELICNLYDIYATTYSEKADYEETLASPKVFEYHKKALDLRLKMYGEEHLETSYSYHNMGTSIVSRLGFLVFQNDTITNVDMADGQIALTYLVKSWNIKKKFLDAHHEDIQTTAGLIGLLGKLYCILGFRNMKKGDYVKMMDNHIKGLDILEMVDNPNEYPMMQSASSALGRILKTREAYAESMKYLKLSYKLAKIINEEQEYSSLKDEIEKTYSLWIKAEPNNSGVRDQFLEFKLSQ